MMMMTTDILGSQQIHRQVCENSTLQNEAIGIILKTSKDTPTGTLRFMQYLLPMQTRQNVEQVCWQTELKQFMEFENTKTYSVTSMRRSCQVFWIKKIIKKNVENSMQVSRFRNQASHSRRHRIKGSHSLHWWLKHQRPCTQDGVSLSNKLGPPSKKTVQPMSQRPAWQWDRCSHTCSPLDSRERSDYTCHYPHRFTELVTKKKKKWKVQWGAQTSMLQRSTLAF